VRAADSLLTRAWELSRPLPQALVSRYREQVALELPTVVGPDSTTEREAVVKQRIGQQMFRDGLMTLWQCRCAISGLDVPELLRASHAKPGWRATTRNGWTSTTDCRCQPTSMPHSMLACYT
jgi:putative restriction endonuclease